MDVAEQKHLSRTRRSIAEPTDQEFHPREPQHSAKLISVISSTIHDVILRAILCQSTQVVRIGYVQIGIPKCRSYSKGKSSSYAFLFRSADGIKQPSKQVSPAPMIRETSPNCIVGGTKKDRPGGHEAKGNIARGIYMRVYCAGGGASYLCQAPIHSKMLNHNAGHAVSRPFAAHHPV